MSGNSKKRSIFSNPSVAYVILVLFILITSVFFMIGNIYNQNVSDSKAEAYENKEKVLKEKQIAENIKATKNFTNQKSETGTKGTLSAGNDNPAQVSQGNTAENTYPLNNTTAAEKRPKANAGTTAQVKPVWTPDGKKDSGIHTIIVDKLLPAKNEDKSSKQIETWTGWIIDRDCIGVNPLKHTAACNLMGSEDTPPASCYASGLGILLYVPGKAYTAYNTFDQLFMFDESSRTVAKLFLESLPDSWVNNITISITGYQVNNIPVNTDETNFPETDPLKVDHYLKGIHINKIEAAYIDGVSTNILPEPNLVLPR